VKIALFQPNPTVGDLEGNRKKVAEAAARAADFGADLLLAPELVLTGYPPMDLLQRDGFVRDQIRELEKLEASSRAVPIVLGAAIPTAEADAKRLWNAAVVLAEGREYTLRPKTLLPNYDVFDERRHFSAATTRSPVTLPGSSTALGLAICEDAWAPDLGYTVDPVAELVEAGASLILNPSASPWHVGKASERRAMLSLRAAANRTPIVFVNQVGGNDELIFDGGSFVLDAEGRCTGALPLFESAFAIFNVPTEGPAKISEPSLGDLDSVAELESGLVLGIHDYFHKQSLPPNAVIGLSGGIDSAVTAHLAVEALGPDRVLGVAMPGPFSSSHSVEDALDLGRNLGIEVKQVDIRPLFDAYLGIFRDLFGAQEDYGLTQQNIQSRIRGNILMAISNHDQRLVLATGNKSELSLGYCTLYGDTVGGLAVLGDVYKRDVYALSGRANVNGEKIPLRTIEKPPSAELAPGQFDENDLPPYEIIDAILSQAIEGEVGGRGVKAVARENADTAREVIRRLDRNEYKRRQTPLVLRTSRKAFGSGRRLPIVHRYES